MTENEKRMKEENKRKSIHSPFPSRFGPQGGFNVGLCHILHMHPFGVTNISNCFPWPIQVLYQIFIGGIKNRLSHFARYHRRVDLSNRFENIFDSWKPNQSGELWGVKEKGEDTDTRSKVGDSSDIQVQAACSCNVFAIGYQALRVRNSSTSFLLQEIQ